MIEEANGKGNGWEICSNPPSASILASSLEPITCWITSTIGVQDTNDIFLVTCRQTAPVPSSLALQVEITRRNHECRITGEAAKEFDPDTKITWRGSESDLFGAHTTSTHHLVCAVMMQDLKRGTAEGESGPKLVKSQCLAATWVPIVEWTTVLDWPSREVNENRHSSLRSP